MIVFLTFNIFILGHILNLLLQSADYWQRTEAPTSTLHESLKLCSLFCITTFSENKHCFKFLIVRWLFRSIRTITNDAPRCWRLLLSEERHVFVFNFLNLQQPLNASHFLQADGQIIQGLLYCRCMCTDWDCVETSYWRENQACPLHEQDGSGFTYTSAGGRAHVPGLPENYWECQCHHCHLWNRRQPYGRHQCKSWEYNSMPGPLAWFSTLSLKWAL